MDRQICLPEPGEANEDDFKTRLNFPTSGAEQVRGGGSAKVSALIIFALQRKAPSMGVRRFPNPK